MKEIYKYILVNDDGNMYNPNCHFLVISFKKV